MKSYALLGAAVAAALVAPVVAPSRARAADKVVWNLSLWGASRAATRNDEYLSKYVEEHSNGNFVIKLHYGEEISPAKANLDGIKVQAFEMGDYCAGYHPGKVPVSVQLELPFLPIYSYEAKMKIHQAWQETPEAKKELARWGAIYYAPHALPTSEFMGVGNPPLKIEDWKGRRARALGGVGDAMRKLGAVPTSMPAPEIYTALERGTIDAVALPFTYAFASYKLDELSKWYTVNMTPGTTSCHTVISKPAYDKLPAEYQKLIWDSKPGGEKAQGDAYKAADDVNFPKWHKKGLIEVKYTAEQLKQISAIAGKPIWETAAEDLTKKGMDGKKMIEYLLKLCEDNKSS